MTVYLASRGEESALHMGTALREFLEELSRTVEWEKFQQMFTLVMLLVQYTMECVGNRQLVGEGSVDLLCDHINPFAQGGLREMTSRFEIDHLSIFESDVMLQLFQAFFQWLNAKKYTNYRITLNADFANPL